MTTLDVSHVRSHYPAFEHPETSRWAFFENAGGSYVPRQVSDRLHRFFTEYKVQPYGHSYMQQQAGDAMDAGYAVAAAMINADPDEVTLGPSTTMNLYVLAQALRPGLSAGDEIIITNQDHEANIGCWRRLEEFGVKLREWRIDPDTGDLSADDLEGLVTDRTRIICFSLCSNIVGTMNDVAAVCDIARSVGAVTVADGVSFAPHRMPDVRTLGPDFLVFSTYKTFATHLGVLWGKGERLAELAPQGHFFNADKPHYRMNPAGPLHAEIGALAGLGQYVEDLHGHHFPELAGRSLREQTEDIYNLFSAHETALANRILEFAHARNDLRIIGRHEAAPERRAGTIAFVPASRTPEQVARALAEHDVAAGAGHFYAWRCLQGLGIDPESGVVRISLVHYNSAEDVDRLIAALEESLDGRRNSPRYT